MNITLILEINDALYRIALTLLGTTWSVNRSILYPFKYLQSSKGLRYRLTY
jgi:hypothetical protein